MLFLLCRIEKIIVSRSCSIFILARKHRRVSFEGTISKSVSPEFPLSSSELSHWRRTGLKKRGGRGLKRGGTSVFIQGSPREARRKKWGEARGKALIGWLSLHRFQFPIFRVRCSPMAGQDRNRPASRGFSCRRPVFILVAAPTSLREPMSALLS